MKARSLLVLILLLLITPLTGHSQDASEQTVSRLKVEIAKREQIDRDQNVPEDLKAQNRIVLEKRREELVRTVTERSTGTLASGRPPGIGRRTRFTASYRGSLR